jgi:[acyl-carrier-protein] S-malonyltransferase
MIALIFPGQGSQRPHMGLPWRDHPSWGVVGQLSSTLGRDLATLLLDADEDELQATCNAQVAAYALSLVVLDAVRKGPLAGGAWDQVTAVAGHSLGEYTALTAAGALDAAEGARLVQARGEAMQAASDTNPGTMAAVLGLSPAEVTAACEEVQGVWVANDNAPGQVVLAGSLEGVASASAVALGRGSKRVIPLRVGGAFHTPFMKPAQAPLDGALARANFACAACTVVANVDAQPHRDQFAELLSRQLCSRVRWRESLVALASMGTGLFVELGPGTELSGMVRRTVPEAARANVATPEDLGSLAGRLAQSGP